MVSFIVQKHPSNAVRYPYTASFASAHNPRNHARQIVNVYNPPSHPGCRISNLQSYRLSDPHCETEVFLPLMLYSATPVDNADIIDKFNN